MPSNHVYGTIIDRYGYLWICTDRGVARYNGYECKTFTVADGLPSNDIWELLEDRKGRIWLGSIAGEIGYIFNGKYEKAEIKDYTGTIFPAGMVKYRDGVMFGSQFINSSVSPSLCLAINDTVCAEVLDDSLFRNFDKGYKVSTVWPSVNGRVYAIHKKWIYEISSIDSVCSDKRSLQPLIRYKFEEYENMMNSEGFLALIVGHLLIFYKPGCSPGELITLNINTGVLDTFSIKKYGFNGSIDFVNYKKGSYDSVLYVYTKGNVCFYKLTDTLSFLYSFDTKCVFSTESKRNRVVAYSDIPLWDTCIGTTTQGIYFKYAALTGFKRAGIDLTGCQYVGVVDDNRTYWWNNEENILLEVSEGSHVKRVPYFDNRKVSRVAKFNRDTMLIFSATSYYYSRIADKCIKLDGEIYGASVKSAIINSGDSFILAAISGIYKARRYGYLGRNVDYLYLDRCSELIEDSYRNKTWAYNKSKIIIFGDNKDRILTKKQIQTIGALYVNGLCVDKNFGNAFILGASSLVMYDYETGKGITLLNNVNLEGAQIRLLNDFLVVVSSLGVVQYKVVGKNKVSAPVYCQNIKHSYYDQVFDVGLTNQEILIVTDKGTYSVATSFFEKEGLSGVADVTDKYRLLAVFNDHKVRLFGGDTLIIKQDTKKQLFDVINPHGIGALKFFFRGVNDTDFVELNSNELNLSYSYKPGNYYQVQLYVGDNGWKSDVCNFTVYINPYWWQTNTAIRLIWIASILLGIGIVSVAIFVTRKIVLKSAERKQLNMEMELKSIYAQINPHFIFNTLGSAMLLASNNKMEEVYTHISKFSRLLRSYLRSSRNKYISVGEEAENLRNYIELQQTRFKNRFRYELNVSRRIDETGMKIPSLLIQPFVENAINHGILEKQEGDGCLKISFDFAEKENAIICVVDDNGIGRNESRLRKLRTKEGRESYGDLMIKDLIDIFNRYEGIEIVIDYIDKKAPESGTTVMIKIMNKVWNKKQ